MTSTQTAKTFAPAAAPRTDRLVRELCAWCGPVFLVLFLIGFLVADLVPPLSAAHGADEIAAFYREHTGRIHAGSLIAMIATPLMVPFLVLLTAELKHSDRRLAALADTQLICGVLFMLLIYLPVTLVALAAFRPQRPAESTQLINDVGMLSLFWTISIPALEFVALGLAILLDRGAAPPFPRWTGWFNQVVGAVFCVGAVGLFTKSGVFAWDGLLGFWAILGAFGLWIIIMFTYQLRAVRRS